MLYFLFPGRSLNLVPRVLSYPHYGARERTGRRENLGTRLGEAPVAEGFELDIFGIPQLETVDFKTRYLFPSKTDKARLSDLREQLFRHRNPGDCLGLLHLRAQELTTV